MSRGELDEGTEAAIRVSPSISFGGASRASAAEGGGALWRARPKAASPQRALRYRKVLRACSKSERVAYFCGADDSSSSSLLASMDELAAPCPEDSRGSASGLGSERSLIGRPAKPEAEKQRSKSWRCTREAPSEAQQSRIRAAGMDRCTSKLHTADCLVRSLPACPRRRRPVIGARVHRRWRRASSYCTSDGAAPAGPPNTRPSDSSSHVELVLAAPGAGCVGLAPLRGFPCKTWP